MFNPLSRIVPPLEAAVKAAIMSAGFIVALTLLRFHSRPVFGPQMLEASSLVPRIG